MLTLIGAVLTSLAVAFGTAALIGRLTGARLLASNGFRTAAVPFPATVASRYATTAPTIVLALPLCLALGASALPYAIQPCLGGPCGLASAVRRAEASRSIVDRSGALLGDTRSMRYVRLSDLPPYIPDLAIAVEDARFGLMPCVDPISVARAAVHTLILRHRQGASTLCMQAVRFLPLAHPLRPDGTWPGKVAETALAVQLFSQTHGDKNRILELYLNAVGFGQDSAGEIRGIEAAALRYFGKPSAQLSLAEAATLIGMVQATTRYNPRRNPDLARERRLTALRLLAEHFPRFRQQALEAQTAMVAVRQPVFTDGAARLRFVEAYDTAQGDSVFRTTLDRTLQLGVDSIAAALLKSVEMASDQTSTRESLQIAALLMDRRTGEIRSYSCGRPGDSRSPVWDPCRSGRIALASIAKPFLLAAAMESGTAMLGEAIGELLARGRASIVNSEFARQFCTTAARHLSVRRAFEISHNCLALALLAVLPDAELAHLRRLGLDFDIRNPASALGTATVSPALLLAYTAAIANGGRIPTPHLAESAPVVVPAAPSLGFRPSSLAAVHQLMRGVVERGTARSALPVLGHRPAYAKTGTNQDTDVRVVGGRDDNAYVALLWIGHARPKVIAPRLDAGRILSKSWAEMLVRTDNLGEPSHLGSVEAPVHLQPGTHVGGLPSTGPLP